MGKDSNLQGVTMPCFEHVPVSGIFYSGETCAVVREDGGPDRGSLSQGGPSVHHSSNVHHSNTAYHINSVPRGSREAYANLSKTSYGRFCTQNT